MTLTFDIETTPPPTYPRPESTDMTAPDPRIEIVVVTRTLAQQMLASNIDHNRKVVQSIIDKYARDMDGGTWHLNGDTIKISADGRLFDGQHRLRALLQSKRRSLRMAVAYNVDPESVATVDTGRARSFADQLRIEESVRSNVVAQVVRRTLLWESGFRAAQGGKVPIHTHTELLTRYRKEPELFVAAAARGSDATRVGLGPPWVPGLMYVLTQGINPEDSHQFFDHLISGANLPEASPILALRRRLTMPVVRAEAYKPIEKLYVYVRAWNDWRRNIPANYYLRPRFGITNANFPVPR